MLKRVKFILLIIFLIIILLITFSVVFIPKGDVYIKDILIEDYQETNLNYNKYGIQNNTDTEIKKITLNCRIANKGIRKLVNVGLCFDEKQNECNDIISTKINTPNIEALNIQPFETKDYKYDFLVIKNGMADDEIYALLKKTYVYAYTLKSSWFSDRVDVPYVKVPFTKSFVITI